MTVLVVSTLVALMSNGSFYVINVLLMKYMFRLLYILSLIKAFFFYTIIAILLLSPSEKNN